ncbi:MAG: TraR/DksA family transcriptional regulator [Sulfuricellaceae bacterium]|jgi:DnaK suppressor protein
MAPLTAPQAAQLKKQLQQQKAALWEDIRAELERSGNQKFADLAGEVRDPGEESVAAMLVDIDAAIVDRQVREIRDIEDALARIADGVYGACTDCGADIGVDRLLAYPTALRCIRCQDQHEKTHGGEGKPTL